MPNFQEGLMETVKNLFQQLYDNDEVNLEYRYYEIWNMVLVEMIRSLDVTYNITVSPQWELIREVLIKPLNSIRHRRVTESGSEDSKSDSQTAAENYLANLSTEVELDDLAETEQIYDLQEKDSNDSDAYDTAESDDEGELGTELRKPDFILFCISAALRKVILIVEVKPGSEVTRLSSEKVGRQAEIQAGFAFDIWPQESIVYSLMLVGRMFRLKKFVRTKVSLSQHKLGRSDMESYKPIKDSLSNDQGESLTAWKNVFDEELVTHESGGQTITTFLEMRRFSQGFKDAMKEVMDHNGLGSVKWGNC